MGKEHLSGFAGFQGDHRLVCGFDFIVDQEAYLKVSLIVGSASVVAKLGPDQHFLADPHGRSGKLDAFDGNVFQGTASYVDEG